MPKSAIHRPWVISLLAILVIALATAGGSWIVGGVLIASVHRTIGECPADLNAEPVSFRNGTGERIAGWYVPGERGQGAILLLHGVRGSRLDMVGRARFLNRDGYSVLLIDFSGHGESGGDSISFGFHEAGDVQAAVDFLAAHAPDERIGAVACSMGAAALVRSSGRDRVQAMVLESMYPTIDEAVSDRIAHRLGQWSRFLTPLLLWQMEPRLGFGPEQLRPIDDVASLHAPKLFIAGASDPLTRLAESERIFTQSASPKSFWVIPGAGHVDLYARAGREYEERVLAFLSSELRGGERARR